jgi:exodeoxyribonuclease VII large subunit
MLSAEKITLFELNQKVKEALALSFTAQYWVIAEISEIKENSSGHCYLELIQKEDLKDSPKAKARATIWAYTYRMLKPYFETTTGRPLSSGMKVLVSVEVIFHEVYGFSLNIVDIEPSFTIGDIEQKRREAIEKLIAEGVYDMNKGLQLPILPKRIAVVSSPTAAGLQDFVNQLLSNKYSYTIEHTLFTANMQGPAAEESIISALNRIYEIHTDFDLVAILRGGGSQADLSCFDSYWLAAHVAQFPLPVITGIGHDKDVSVVDLVAHTMLKTPTAVAEFILDKFIEAEEFVLELKERLEMALEETISSHRLQFEKILTSIAPSILQSTSNEKLLAERIQKKLAIATNQFLTNERTSITKTVKSFELNTLVRLAESSSRIKQESRSLINNARHFIDNQYNRMDRAEIQNSSLNPANILKRGYSITLLNGKILKDSADVEQGSVIRTILNKGEVESIIT